MITVKLAGRFLIAAALIALTGAAAAQEYPSRVIRIVVPSSPGSASDLYARIIASALQASWGRQAIVENRAGATGAIGSEFVLRSPPDGYTLLFTTDTGYVLGPLLMEPRPYDIVADATPITKVAKFPLYLVIHPSIPARSLTEFIALARSRPGSLNYSSSGQGGISHMAAELFNSAAGIKASHLPYKGGGPALQAVVTGEGQYLFNNIGLSQALVAAGRLRGVAITGDKRSPAAPAIPTFSEAGIRGMENVYSWLGVLGPAKLPPAIVSRLNTELIRIMRTPEFEGRVLKDGYTLVANTPTQFASEIQSDVDVWSRVIRDKGIKAQ